MESAQKAESRKGTKSGERISNENDSEEELLPPSPIHIVPEAAMAPDFDFPDPQELRRIESDTQNRLKAILEVAGVTGLSQIDARTFQDPEILRKLTNSVSTALDEAATALTRMKTEKQSYEAFLRGATQAPSPSIPPTSHQQPPPPPVSMALSQGKVAPPKQEQPSVTQPQQQPHHHLRQQPSQQTPGDNMQAVQRLLTQGHGIHDATEDGESLLSLACSAGYYELAEVLLRMRASVEDRGVKGDSTPLMEAASGGYADIVKLLIDHGANVNAKSSVGNTALTYACCGGYEDVVKILLEAGAEVEHQNENGHTPLMEAASCGHVGVAKLLLDYGANINTHSNEFKESALTLACYKGHLEMVKFLLGAGADQEHKTDEMHTALMEASMDGHVDVARLLLDHGAQVNMPVDSFESPLTLAACGGHYELAALLLSRGADLEEVNDEGYTPLMEAAREGHEDVVQLLVEHGANVNAQTEETQETALTLACCGGFLEVAQYLIEHRADIELGASTPLMEAAQEGHVDIVKFLIEKGANIHAETNTMDTALTYACANGHTTIADILLQCGAELEHESEGGRTPLMKAARAGHLQTVQFLVAKGAEVNRNTSNNDHSVLSLASAGGHVSVVQYLLMQGADPDHMLRDNSTMLIEASRGGHTAVANLLLRQPRGSHSLPITSSSSQKAIEFDQDERKVTTTHKPTQQELAAAQGVSISTQKTTKTLLQPQNVTSEASQQQCHWEEKQLEAGMSQEREQLQKQDLKPNGVEQQKTGAKRPKISQEDRPKDGLDGTSAVAPDVAAQYAADSSTALKNIQRLTATTGAASSQFGGVSPEDIIQGHVTAEDIINQYWMQRARQSSASEGTADGPGGETMSETAQSMFSAGNFGRDLPLHPQGATLQQPYAVPKFHASSNSTNGSSEGNASTQPLDSFLSNADISRLIPQLEAIAGSLHPSSLESQYLAALAQSQMLPALVSATGGNQALPNVEAAQAANAEGKEVNNLPSVVAEMARFLPSLANLETQTVELPVELRTQPIYSTEFHPLKQLSQKMHSSNSDSYSEQTFDVDVRPRSLSASFLLDGNFPLDIPPPADLIPDHLPNMLPSGYMGSSLDNESYPTSEEEEEVEEESDSSYLAQDLSALPPGPYEPAIDIEQQTDSNHDTALTLAAAGGHDELVELLLAHGANIEHRDKKGCTPLILAASAGHAVTVAILLDHNADIEAQSDRTKDTALSLACSGGRQEVVELLLAKGANFEHRNVSDYTPLSLAASGGYVNIIKLLLRAGADINSRTGSKLGISPLMLAAMNGHTPTVKLLLDMGSDINAQIETNRNTALTLACFQGRHEVVNLLVERQANVEHRAKTGLTPLMEAASGGYHEVGKVLIVKGADVNAAPVPSSRDTALTIAADKGHYKFVELILRQGAHVDVKNKKGNSPLWLACNGGHLDVVRLLVEHAADVDSQDNRKVSCLMAAFRKGHFKVVKYLVDHVSQFPSDAELTRYVNTLSDKELLKKCQRCMEVIIDAKERQAAEANKNATILLQEIDQEKKHEEDRKAAAARKRAKKKRQKEKKQAQKAQTKGEKGNSGDTPPEGDPDEHSPDDVMGDTDDIIDATPTCTTATATATVTTTATTDAKPVMKERHLKSEAAPKTTTHHRPGGDSSGVARVPPMGGKARNVGPRSSNQTSPTLRSLTATISVSPLGTVTMATMTTPTSSPKKGKKEEGWKEVGRRTKKITIPATVFATVVGKNSSNLIAIRHATNTQIEVDKHSRQSPHRTITVRGSVDAIKHAQHYISVLLRDPNRDLSHLLPSHHKKSGHPTPQDLPPLSTLDTFDELSDVPLTKSNNVSVGITVATSTVVNAAAKGVYKKVGPVGAVVSTTVVVPTSTKSLSNVPSSHNQSTTAGGKVVRTTSSDRKNQSSQSTAAISDPKCFNPDITTATATTGIVMTTVNTTSHTSLSKSSIPVTSSGPVRRLFTSSMAAQTTTVASATQTVPYPPKLSTSSTVTISQKPPTVTTTNIVPSKPTNVPPPPPMVATIAPIGKQSRPAETALRVSEALPKYVAPFNKGVSLTYSGVMGFQDNTQTSSVIEQPLQQIMKTPTILQEPATQITKPKKKSTYSDAVGKKLSTTDPSSKMAPLNTGSNQFIPTQAPPSQVTQPKLNLAPGSRPTVSDTGDKPSLSQPTKPSPWNDAELRQSYEDDERISPSATNLGPIGPPSRSSRHSISGHFSPSASHHSKMSPPGAINTSPQRNEQSPAAKSPLLGTAPPGLLPPPDKGLYSTAFRPIHADFVTTDSGNFQTLIPTPMRNPRPPLLATPPGFAHPLLSQGMPHSPLLPKQGQNPGSPVPSNLSPERSMSSPSKSPPHHPLGKGFNPNAPTFIPMGLQNMQRPANPPTSSILGAPPPMKLTGFPGTSLLGSAPQIPTTVYGNTRIISPPTLITTQQPQPSLQGNQSSILGQPPMPPLNPQIFASPPTQQSFPGLANRQNQPLFGQQFDGNQPPPSESLMPFSINLMPFPSPNPSEQPTQTFAATLKESFPGVLESSLIPPSAQPPCIMTSVNSADFSKFGSPHAGVVPGPMMLSASGSSNHFDAAKPQMECNNLLNQFSINLGQLGPIPGTIQDQIITEDGQKTSPPSLTKFSTGNFSKNPTIDSFPPLQPYAMYLQTSGMSNTSSGTSSGYVMVAPGIFTTPSQAENPTSESEAIALSDNLPPIGTERAHKRSSSLPGSSAFPVIAPGINPSNVWSYSGNPTTSEDSDWSNEPSDWPSLSNDIINPGGDIVISSQDNLESVLEKLGLIKYHSLLTSNEVDLDALLLMSEKDFSEIGLPKGPRIKLLGAIGRKPSEVEVFSEDPLTGQHSEDVASQGSGPDQPESSSGSQQSSQ